MGIAPDDWKAHFGLFKTEAPPAAQVNGLLANQHCEAVSLSLNWMDAHGIFQPPGHFLVASLTPVPIMQCYYGDAMKPAYRLAGDVMWLPPGAALNCHWGTGRQNTVACVFDVDQLSHLAELDWDWSAADIRAGLDIRNPYLRMAMQRIAEEVESPGFASDLQIEYTLMFLFLELRRHFQKRGDEVGIERGKLTNAQMLTLRDIIEENIAGTASLKALSKALGMGTRQLSQMFRNSTGMTLRTYVAQARIRRAQTLLLDENMLAKQVAYESGFRDPASFAAAFRRSTGLTPSEFRNFRHGTSVQ